MHLIYYKMNHKFWSSSNWTNHFYHAYASTPKSSSPSSLKFLSTSLLWLISYPTPPSPLLIPPSSMPTSILLTIEIREPCEFYIVPFKKTFHYVFIVHWIWNEINTSIVNMTIYWTSNIDFQNETMLKKNHRNHQQQPWNQTLTSITQFINEINISNAHEVQNPKWIDHNETTLALKTPTMLKKFET